LTESHGEHMVSVSSLLWDLEERAIKDCRYLTLRGDAC